MRARPDRSREGRHARGHECRSALQNTLRKLRTEDGAPCDVPYTKQLARQLRDGTFRSDSALLALRTNPTLSAGIMERALELLNR